MSDQPTDDDTSEHAADEKPHSALLPMIKAIVAIMVREETARGRERDRIQPVKSRFLTASEKRDVAVAAMEALKLQNPGCHVHVEVEDWTDSRGVPQWTATIRTPREEDQRG